MEFMRRCHFGLFVPTTTHDRIANDLEYVPSQEPGAKADIRAWQAVGDGCHGSSRIPSVAAVRSGPSLNSSHLLR